MVEAIVVLSVIVTILILNNVAKDVAAKKAEMIALMQQSQQAQTPQATTFASPKAASAYAYAGASQVVDVDYVDIFDEQRGVVVDPLDKDKNTLLN